MLPASAMLSWEIRAYTATHPNIAPFALRRDASSTPSLHLRTRNIRDASLCPCLHLATNWGLNLMGSGVQGETCTLRAYQQNGGKGEAAPEFAQEHAWIPPRGLAERGENQISDNVPYSAGRYLDDAGLSGVEGGEQEEQEEGGDGVFGCGLGGVVEISGQERRAVGQRKGNRSEKWGESDEDEAQRRRFRMRNGREILEERAFLVGVELRATERTPNKSGGVEGSGNNRRKKTGAQREALLVSSSGSEMESGLASSIGRGTGAVQQSFGSPEVTSLFSPVSPLSGSIFEPTLALSASIQPGNALPGNTSAAAIVEGRKQGEGGRGASVEEERKGRERVDSKEKRRQVLFPVEESLEELSRLCDTAGLQVVGRTSQRMVALNPKTYIGSGKVQEVKAAIRALNVETVVFDDELSPGQLRSLEKELGEGVRVCDRTALILDIFSQRAATKEATLQVELAQAEYQLPRLTRMWTHLERQAGGMVKGMGEKQIEVDKRILRDRMGALKQSLLTVQGHRQQYRKQRAQLPVPVISLVGYTNAGKSTLMNRLSGAGVLAEDQLFATLDPTTRRIQLPNGKECLLTDTVGFIQKLPTQLIAAFRATLEEIADASVLLHVVDASDPMAEQQMAAVEQVLEDLGVGDIPSIRVLNKIDSLSHKGQKDMLCEDIGIEAESELEAGAQDFQDRARRSATGMRMQHLEDPSADGKEAVEHAPVAVSALTGEGIPELFSQIQVLVNKTLVSVEALVPYCDGDVLDSVYRLGTVAAQEHTPEGTWIQAHVPLRLAQNLLPYRKNCSTPDRLYSV